MDVQRRMALAALLVRNGNRQSLRMERIFIVDQDLLRDVGANLGHLVLGLVMGG
jgi:hypothetical protein